MATETQQAPQQTDTPTSKSAGWMTVMAILMGLAVLFTCGQCSDTYCKLKAKAAQKAAQIEK